MRPILRALLAGVAGGAFAFASAATTMPPDMGLADVPLLTWALVIGAFATGCYAPNNVSIGGVRDDAAGGGAP